MYIYVVIDRITATSTATMLLTMLTMMTMIMTTTTTMMLMTMGMPLLMLLSFPRLQNRGQFIAIIVGVGQYILFLKNHYK